MTGLPDWNRKSFYDAAKQLTDLGYDVVNPLDLPEPVLPPKDGEYTYSERWAAYLTRDIAFIHELAQGQGSCVLLLPGWENSKGSCLEAAVAQDEGLLVATLGSFLKYYVKKEPYSFPWPRKKVKA